MNRLQTLVRSYFSHVTHPLTSWNFRAFIVQYITSIICEIGVLVGFIKIYKAVNGENLLDEYPNMYNDARLVDLIIIGIFAGITEELLFRGFGNYVRSKNQLFGNLVTLFLAIAWAFAHGKTRGVAKLAPAVFYVRLWKVGRWKTAISTHVGHNIVFILLGYFQRKVESFWKK